MTITNSIIIISKGQERSLMSCLTGLKNQVGFNESWEIVPVIYDMSTNLKEFIYNLDFDIELNLIECSKPFSRSSARNIGANAAKGNYLIFCDNDMVLSKNFFMSFETDKCLLDGYVGIHPMLGYRLTEESEVGRYFIKNSFDSEMLEAVKDSFEVSDYRKNQLLVYGNDLSNASFPWVFCWSALFSISKENFCMIGGFDLKFELWGGEDTDLAIRCFENKLLFRYLTNSYGFHIPHASKSNEIDSLELRKFLFERHPPIGTELLQYMTGLGINAFYDSYKSLINLNPVYPIDFLKKILSNLQSNKRVLVIGINQDTLPTEFQSFEYLSSFIGLSTLYQDNEFDEVIIFDSYRFLPTVYLEKIYDEMLRISSNISQIYTNCYLKESEMLKDERIKYIAFEEV